MARERNNPLLSTQQNVQDLNETSLIIEEIEVETQTSAYAAGDVLIPATAIERVTLYPNQGAILNAVHVADVDEVDPAIDFLFFSEQVSVGAVNAALTLGDSDADKYLGNVSVVTSDYADLGPFGFAAKEDLNVLLKSDEEARVWFAASVTGTPTFLTTAALKVRFGILQF